MKKHLQKMHRQIKNTLEQEVTTGHWIALVGLPIFVYIAAYLYTQALSTKMETDVPVHTRVVYYDGNFSQDIAIEELDTSVYVVNETKESIKATSYEYLKNNNQNSLGQATINPEAQLLLTTKKPSLILLQNQSGKQSLIIVGKNKLGDEDRAAIIKKSIMNLLNTKSEQSPAYAALQLSKLRLFDVSTNAICESIYKDIENSAKSIFTNQNIYIQPIQEICGFIQSTSTSKIEGRNSTTSLGNFIKNSIVNKNNVLEFSMPNGY